MCGGLCVGGCVWGVVCGGGGERGRGRGGRLHPYNDRASHPAMTNTITGTDERRFATEGSTERLAGFARLGLWTLQTHLCRL